jgi:hypothetical protein
MDLPGDLFYFDGTSVDGQEVSVIPSHSLKQFVLEYGLANLHQGRTTTLPALLTEAERKYGRCTRRELLDVLYDLRPEDVEYQQLISGNRGQLHPIRFERNSVHWEKFFDSEFSIRVLPQGRELALHPDQQLGESPSTKSCYAIGLKVRHTAA